MLGVDAQLFAEIAATAFTPRPVPTVATEHLHELMVSVPEQAEHCWPNWNAVDLDSGPRSPSWSPTAGSRS